MSRRSPVESNHVLPSRQSSGSAVTSPSEEPAWKQRAVERSIKTAKLRAAQRVQRFLDAAQAIIIEKGSTDFTVQEVVDRSRQSLRSFYLQFDGKHELLLALFEDALSRSADQIRAATESHTDPLERLQVAVGCLRRCGDMRRDRFARGSVFRPTRRAKTQDGRQTNSSTLYQSLHFGDILFDFLQCTSGKSTIGLASEKQPFWAVTMHSRTNYRGTLAAVIALLAILVFDARPSLAIAAPGCVSAQSGVGQLADGFTQMSRKVGIPRVLSMLSPSICEPCICTTPP